MSSSSVSPSKARAMLAEGATLIDIREPDEHRRERIPGARNHPLSQVEADPPRGDSLILHCKMGQRTAANLSRLQAACGNADVYVLDGGIDAWRNAGLPTTIDRGQPLEIMRQVQIGAGSLVLVGVSMGALVHPAFYALSGLVGAGLLTAGVTGFCGMARVLKHAPWNRLATAA